MSVCLCTVCIGMYEACCSHTCGWNRCFSATKLLSSVGGVWSHDAVCTGGREPLTAALRSGESGAMVPDGVPTSRLLPLRYMREARGDYHVG